MSQVHHKIIHSKDQIIEFANTCFRISNSTEAITTGLVARKKYHEALSSHSACVADIIQEGTIDAEKFYRYVLRFEVPLGSYIDIKTGEIIPDSAFAVYVDLDVKDTSKALSSTLNEMMNKLHYFFVNRKLPIENKELENIKSYTRYRKIIRSTYAVQQNKLIQIDIDTKDKDELTIIKNKLTETGVKNKTIMVVETKGGYHLVFESDKSIDNKSLYLWCKTTEISKLDSLSRSMTDTVVTIKPHASVILPGTYHGGFAACICRNFFD